MPHICKETTGSGDIFSLSLNANILSPLLTTTQIKVSTLVLVPTANLTCYYASSEFLHFQFFKANGVYD